MMSHIQLARVSLFHTMLYPPLRQQQQHQPLHLPSLPRAPMIVTLKKTSVHGHKIQVTNSIGRGIVERHHQLILDQLLTTHLKQVQFTYSILRHLEGNIICSCWKVSAYLFVCGRIEIQHKVMVIFSDPLNDCLGLPFY